MRARSRTCGQSANASRDGNIVRCTSGAKRGKCEVGDLDRVIDQLVVVRSSVVTEAPRRGARVAQRRRHAPSGTDLPGRGRDLPLAWRVAAAFGTQEHARSIEVGTRRVEIRGANRQIERVDARNDGEYTRARRRAPKILGFLRDGNRHAVAFGADGYEVPREFADQVAPGNPGRELEALSRDVRIDDGAAHLEQMRMRVDRRDAVIARETISVIVASLA
jgi:hypothetical protein